VAALAEIAVKSQKDVLRLNGGMLGKLMAVCFNNALRTSLIVIGAVMLACRGLVSWCSAGKTCGGTI
jgi:hypothetical protein